MRVSIHIDKRRDRVDEATATTLTRVSDIDTRPRGDDWDKLLESACDQCDEPWGSLASQQSTCRRRHHCRRRGRPAPLTAVGTGTLAPRSDILATFCRRSAKMTSNHNYNVCTPNQKSGNRTSFLPRCMECRRGLAMRILSVRPFVCQTRDLWQNKRKICPDFYTMPKTLSVVFWEREWLVGQPLLPEISGQPASVGAKSSNFSRYSFAAPQR